VTLVARSPACGGPRRGGSRTASAHQPVEMSGAGFRLLALAPGVVEAKSVAQMRMCTRAPEACSPQSKAQA
jgi:hypothetical protein